jgi:hypothetical protein
MANEPSSANVNMHIPTVSSTSPIAGPTVGSSTTTTTATTSTPPMLSSTMTSTTNNKPVNETQHRLDPRFAKHMKIKSADRHVKTRLYFTSESHMHSLLNVLRYAYVADDGLAAPHSTHLKKLEQVDELDYLSHIVFRLFEVKEDDAPTTFIVRVGFSPGVTVSTSMDNDGLLNEVGIATYNSDTIAPLGMAGRKVLRVLPPGAPIIPIWTDCDFQKAVDVLNIYHILHAKREAANSKDDKGGGGGGEEEEDDEDHGGGNGGEESPSPTAMSIMRAVSRIQPQVLDMVMGNSSDNLSGMVRVGDSNVSSGTVGGGGGGGDD